MYLELASTGLRSLPTSASSGREGLDTGRRAAAREGWGRIGASTARRFCYLPSVLATAVSAFVALGQPA